MTTVSGVAFPGGGIAELRSFEIDEPGPNEVRLQVRASGICGSDLHSYDSDHGLRAWAPADDRSNPLTPRTGDLLIGGHEPAGVIEAIGSDVKDFAIGDRVLAYHIMGCGNCEQCRAGQSVLCSSDRRAAYGGERNGGHAPLLLVDQHSLIRLPDNLSFIDGAMIACGVATAYAAIKKAGVQTGQSLLVTGLGPVGLAVVQLASEMGVVVIGSDLNPGRLEQAKLHGLTHALDPNRPGLEQVRELTGGRGVEGAIDAAGATAARKLCLDAAAVRGVVVFVGVALQEMTINPTLDVISRSLTIRGSWVSSLAEMEDVTRLLAARHVHPESLVTKRYTIDQAAEAYETFAAGLPGKSVFVY
jgi:threonine dehydrogenase-like Zn-dependent dehydrogenase